MLIRFLDGKEVCYQVDTHKTPVLVFLESQEEIDYVRKIEKGGCLMMIPKPYIGNAEATERIKSKLNTTEEPKNLK